MAVTPAVRPVGTHWRPAGLAWALWALAMLGLAAIPWFDHLLREAGRPELAQLDASGVPAVLAIVSATTVGAVLASRRSRHPVGWLLLGLGLSVSASGVADGYAPYGLLIRPGTLPAAGYAALYGPVLLAIAITCIGFILLLTPTGSLPSSRWRWWARVATAAPVVVLAAMLTQTPALFGWGLALCAAVLPLAIGAAILRYRLYDLDRIVSRTLAYGLLTVLLGGGYAGVVLGLGQLLGQESSLVVAGATLAVAALFQPARRRVQAAVDRRFNRRRYDAAQTIQAFSARLRQQVDLDTLTAELLGMVDQTMQPTNVSLWLRRSVSASPVSSPPTAVSPPAPTAL